MSTQTVPLWDPDDPDDPYNQPLHTPAEYRDIAAVNLALRQLGHLAAEQEALKAAAHAELDRIREWERARVDALEARAAWVRQGLRSYLEYAGVDKVRSPNGTAYLTHRAAAVKVTDPPVTLAWAQADPERAGLVRHVPTLDLAAVKAHFAATGELPDGAEVVPAQETLAVRLAPALK